MLLDDKTGHFNETMQAQGKALQEVYDKGYQLVVETDAHKVTKELNELTNFMTTQFGEGVLHPVPIEEHEILVPVVEDILKGHACI